MDSDDDDDVPIGELRKRKAAAPAPAKKAAPVPKDDDAAKKKKKSMASTAAAKKPSAAPSLPEKKQKKRAKAGEDDAHPKKKKTKTATATSSSKPPASPMMQSPGKKRSAKELSKLQRVEEAIKAFEWWTVPELPEGQVFQTLEHNGVAFAPAYEPHGVKLKYDGDDVDLTPEQEEVATYYAAMPEDGPQLSPTGGQRETFQANFFEDFRKVLAGDSAGKKSSHHVIKSFSKCDFEAIRAHLDRQKAARKAASDAEKKDAKAAKDAEQLAIGYALLDGRVQKVGNFRMEPPSLFRGRGKHPKTGTLKQRTQPEQIAINCGSSNCPPKCPEPGRAWGSVQHDDSVTWLASWHENVMQQNKYVMLAANSSLKGKSDYLKFEKAQQLKGCIERIRHSYRSQLGAKDARAAQLATAMWLIDVYALRVGGEKGDDEADTVGCCSLRVEHFAFPADDDAAMEVELEFLGKDSMLFKQTIDFDKYGDVGRRVFRNLKDRFCARKTSAQQVFEHVSPPELNAHLSSLMPGLTAKVFRTYNASDTLQNELPDAAEVRKMDTVGDKLVAYNEANRKVAILCNHQRTVSAAASTGLATLAERLDVLKHQKRELHKWKKLVAAGHAAKVPLLDKGASGTSAAASGDKAQAAVERAKQLKNAAQSVEDKIKATEAAEKAAQMRRDAQKLKQAEAHKFAKPPASEKDVEKRIAQWTEKIKKAEIDLRNKEENKEVSLGTSKTNYNDPRISVAWCKRCGVPIERIFPKTLQDKFAWAMPVGPDWRFEARPLKDNVLKDDDEDD